MFFGGIEKKKNENDGFLFLSPASQKVTVSFYSQFISTAMYR